MHFLRTREDRNENSLNSPLTIVANASFCYNNLMAKSLL